MLHDVVLAAAGITCPGQGDVCSGYLQQKVTCSFKVQGMQLMLWVMKGHHVTGLAAQQPHPCSLQQVIHLHADTALLIHQQG